MRGYEVSPISGSSSSSRNDDGGKIPRRSTSSRDSNKKIFKETAGKRKDKTGIVMKSEDGTVTGVDGR